jgi:ABC-type enterochelin transport system ATPase subunit
MKVIILMVYSATLLKRYEGQFVALKKGRVVGHGTDDEELALRMFEKFGDAPFYIAKVSKEPIVYELPSPEVVC